MTTPPKITLTATTEDGEVVGSFTVTGAEHRGTVGYATLHVTLAELCRATLKDAYLNVSDFRYQEE